MTKEKVLVFKEKHMDGFKKLPGITTRKTEILYFQHDILKNVTYIDREDAENSPKYKQIIPYVVMTCDDRVLVYKRTKKGGEGRLHEKHSIGIGGHINPIDGKENPVSNAISREITEEVKFPENTKWNLKPFALIYDDSNDVGKVHFGFVWLLEFDKKTKDLPVPAEDAVAEFKWVPKNKLCYTKNLENWSKMVMEIL